MAEVLVGFYEPKVFTAGEAIPAGAACKLDSGGRALKTTAGADGCVGIALTPAAASGDNVTLFRGAVFIPYVAAPASGPLMPGPTGSLVAWASTGTYVGFAEGTGRVFIH